MKIIHITWDVHNSFINSGNLCLWIECHKRTKKDKYYPYQLTTKKLDDFIQQYFSGINFKAAVIDAPIITNSDNEYIPSPIIANLLGIENIEATTFKKAKIDVLRSVSSLHLLKHLNFISHYLDEDVLLADDAKFWIKVGAELSTVIKKDQYIPSIIAHKKNRHTAYTCKWEALSGDYNARLQKIAEYIPLSGCSSIDHTKISVLKHFTEVALTELICQTSIPQRYLKKVEGTIIENALGVDSINIDQPLWKQWKSWRNNLEYDQLGAPFNLVFRLNDPDESDDVWNIEVLMQSKSDLSFMVDIGSYTQNKNQKKSFYQKIFGTSIDHFLLLQIGYAGRLYPIISKIFESNLKSSLIAITKQEAYQFLKENAWILSACGYRIIVPSWWSNKGRSKAKIRLKASQKKGQIKLDAPKTYFCYESLIQFDYSYSVGGQAIDKDEWYELINAKEELVFFKGQWIEIDREEMQKMQVLIDSSEQDKKEGSIRDLLNMASNDDHFDIQMDHSLEDMMNNLTNKEKLTTISTPKNLNATLRPYQIRGLSWLAYLESIGINPCLADDMGLGKTIQVIALLLSRPSDTPALLIAPTSVIGNWDREIKKFAPCIKTLIYHGTQRKGDNFDKAIKAANIVITSFGLARKDKALFQSYLWSRLIVDEAQNIKNPLASQTKALCSIKSNFRIALTGTPVENRLMDLWSIFNFLNPGYLGDKKFFKRHFELPVQKENNNRQTKILKKMVEPFILRRVKTDKNIIKDLPQKIEQKVYCSLTKEQATIYQAVVKDTEKKLRFSSKQEKLALFVSSLLRLKQVCNHPAQLLQDGSAFTVDRSVKLERLVNMTKEIITNGESVLVFSQFTEICDALNKLLKEQCGFNIFYIHGGTVRTKREKMIERFQKSDFPPSVFILSLKAGGTGITLTKANHVIHFDRWWNPAIENQATDRAYRIGQTKTVFAYKYITMGTIEEKIDVMLSDKQKISESIIGTDESWLGKLDTSSFLNLIKLQSDMVTEDATT